MVLANSLGILLQLLFVGIQPSALGANANQAPVESEESALSGTGEATLEVGRHKDAEAILDRAQQATPRFAPPITNEV